VGNDVAEPGSGFGTDTNRVTIFDRDGGREALPLLPKREVADRILDRVARALDARSVDARDGSAQTAGSTPARTLEGPIA
jgi:phosphopantothenoylcysteine decarboxylase/phosphopantothenate--cysteine ligase